MAKVLVERPRRGGGWERPGRRPRSLDDLPPRLKMAPGNGRTKSLNENLSPLKRYLTSQAGRPWNKVYSEICARIDGRHTVQQHILLHLQDFVAVHARVAEQGVEILRWNGWQPLADASVRLYVHPRSGLLRVNRARKPGRRELVRKQARADSAPAESRRILGELEQLHRIDGIWYHVKLEALPEPKLRVRIREGIATKEWICETRWDVVRSVNVSRLHGDRGPGNQPGNRELFGRADVYARTKHQLNTQELRRYGLKG
jgi:hypothetical protein